MTSEPLVSVVTPLYNAEKYIAEAIESVLNQTYRNWEYVIVNNFSKDRSLEVAQEYAERDRRIRIDDNEEFLNAIPNWNNAVRKMSPDAKYLKVLHADDWLFPECVERMVEVAEANPSVGLVGSYRLNEEEVDLDGLPYPSTVVNGRELCRRCLLRRGLHLFGSPTSTLLRADLVRKRENFYNEASIHADTEACYEVLQESDFGFVHQVLSFTRRHNEAITSFINRFNTRMVSRLTVMKKYGPVYLSAEEFARRMGERVNSYHATLAKCLFERKGKDFWDFHRKTLSDLGVPYSRLKMVRPFLRELALRLSRPRRVLRSMLGYFRKREKDEVADAKKLETVTSQSA